MVAIYVAQQMALPLLTYESITILLRGEVALILKTKPDCLVYKDRSVNH